MMASLLFLLFERFVGIGWDFHPDSVTYATVSNDVAEIIYQEGFNLVLNNAYYLWSALFNMDIYILTFLNMIMYSLTNVFLYNFHLKYKHILTPNLWVLGMILLLFNPYRLHLSTTLLKDTMIIMLLTSSVLYALKHKLLCIPTLLLLRVASAIYCLILIKPKILKIIILSIMFLAIIFQDYFYNVLTFFNETEMQLRDFDTMPTFQNWGILGAFIRGISWPFFAITGLFAIISPAAAFFPVALGIIFNQIYVYFIIKKFTVPMPIYAALFVFAILTTGYTAYIRYIYPILVVYPIIAILNNKKIIIEKNDQK